jgi:hypothetical protein
VVKLVNRVPAVAVAEEVEAVVAAAEDLADKVAVAAAEGAVEVDLAAVAVVGVEEVDLAAEAAVPAVAVAAEVAVDLAAVVEVPVEAAAAEVAVAEAQAAVTASVEVEGKKFATCPHPLPLSRVRERGVVRPLPRP